MGCGRFPRPHCVHCHPGHTVEAGIYSLDIVADGELFPPGNC